jgi:hypothetical protein
MLGCGADVDKLPIDQSMRLDVVFGLKLEQKALVERPARSLRRAAFSFPVRPPGRGEGRERAMSLRGAEQ